MRSDKRRDYIHIKDYIENAGSKVLLLTATPYNIRFTDVANQLGLYIDDDDDLGLQPLSAMQKNPRLADQVDGRPTPCSRSASPRKPRTGSGSCPITWFAARDRSCEQLRQDRPRERPRLLALPRRQRFYFPERTPKPIDHSFGDDDPAALMSSDQTLDVIDDLLLPRYNLSAYLDAKREAADEPNSSTAYSAPADTSSASSAPASTSDYPRRAFVRALAERHLARNDHVAPCYRELPSPAGRHDPRCDVEQRPGRRERGQRGRSTHAERHGRL